MSEKMSDFGTARKVGGGARKSYRHKKIGVENICDGKVEKCEKTCFKTAGVNGVSDIYWRSIRKYKKV